MHPPSALQGPGLSLGNEACSCSPCHVPRELSAAGTFESKILRTVRIVKDAWPKKSSTSMAIAIGAMSHNTIAKTRCAAIGKRRQKTAALTYTKRQQPPPVCWNSATVFTKSLRIIHNSLPPLSVFIWLESSCSTDRFAPTLPASPLPAVQAARGTTSHQE